MVRIMLLRKIKITMNKLAGVLSDKDLEDCLKKGYIEISPLYPNSIQPASVDLHLGDEFAIFDRRNNTMIDTKRSVVDMMKVYKGLSSFIVYPGEMVLAVTDELVSVPRDMVGRLEGKSSLARLGLSVHDAGYIDPGNKLKITLEMSNQSGLPIKIYHKMPIAQIAFHTLTCDAAYPYGHKKLKSKYYQDKGVQVSQGHKNFNTK